MLRRRLWSIGRTMLFTVLLFALLEAVARLFNLADPAYVTAPLPDEFRGMAQGHPELFWSLVPNAVKQEPTGAVAHINSSGFRGAELKPKAANEYRILSLGESTTYGAGVEDHETYSAVLQSELNALAPNGQAVNVLNCGVSAYSSFQGLKYLDLYGLDLEPDMVIVYFEINDYLPSTLRNYGFDETTAFKTDAQLYDDLHNNWAAAIVQQSHLLKWLSFKYAQWQIESIDRDALQNPLNGIGIEKDLGVGGRLATEVEGELVKTQIEEAALGQRVSEEERLGHLAAFNRLCAENDIELVVLHPSYRESVPHTCVLTDFCVQNGVTMLECHSVLHPNPDNPGLLFQDIWHPTVEGHRLLGNMLADTLGHRIWP